MQRPANKPYPVLNLVLTTRWTNLIFQAGRILIYSFEKWHACIQMKKARTWTRGKMTPADAYEAGRGCVWWISYHEYWWRHAYHIELCVCVCVCTRVAESISGRWKKSTEMPEGKWDIQRMISIKWSLSCSSSNEILYLRLRLLRPVGRHIEIMCKPIPAANGWHDCWLTSLSPGMCEPMCAMCVCVCVDGFRDPALHNVDRRAPKCSRTVIAIPQPRWSHWRNAKWGQFKSKMLLHSIDIWI